MIEYPSIMNSSKAPRKMMYAFGKMDWSNFRAKWTPKRSFCLYGTRTQLIDATHPDFGVGVDAFAKVAPIFDEMFRKNKEFRNLKEIIVFSELFGPKSFAGLHFDEKSAMKVVPFDIMMIKQNDRRFVRPQDFVDLAHEYHFPRSEVLYRGNLNDEFIEGIRREIPYGDLGEGVVCKGTDYVGNAAGHVWMCKVKTLRYLEKIKQVHGDKWKDYLDRRSS